MKQQKIVCDFPGCTNDVRCGGLFSDEWKVKVSIPGMFDVTVVLKARWIGATVDERSEFDLCDEHRRVVLRAMADD